jgi:hypothetical protein
MLPDFGDQSLILKANKPMSFTLSQFYLIPFVECDKRFLIIIIGSDNSHSATVDTPDFGSSVMVLPRQSRLGVDHKYFWT